jgi:hypothetical protein
MVLPMVYSLVYSIVQPSLAMVSPVASLSFGEYSAFKEERPNGRLIEGPALRVGKVALRASFLRDPQTLADGRSWLRSLHAR